MIGAFFIASYGGLPNEYLMLGFGVVHALCDGLTVSSTGVAVGMVAPPERQAAAQGIARRRPDVHGRHHRLRGGVLYEVGGRGVAFGGAAAVMTVLALGAAVVAGPERRGLRGAVSSVADGVDADPASAVTGHA